MTEPIAAVRDLPSTDRLLAHPALREAQPAALRTQAARQAIAVARQEALAGAPVPPLDELAARAVAVLARFAALSLLPLINASGVILHTNLGRAPLSTAAIAAMQAVAEGYSNLEFDLDAGERGSRFAHLEEPLRR